MSTTVLAPCFDEVAVLERFVVAVESVLGADWELLLVDDGSTDGTGDLVESLSLSHPWLRSVSHPTNRGLGAALRTGFAAAHGDVIVTIDADLSHPVGMIERLVEGCSDADAVYASRFVPGGAMEGVPPHRRLISGLGNRVLRWLFRIPVHDSTTGFRAYRSTAIRAIEFESDGFEAQFEITVRLARSGATLTEIPLALRNRQAGVSKMRYLGLVRSYLGLMIRLLRRR